jgi:hypothetical protein
LDQLTNVTQFCRTNASSGYVPLAYNDGDSAPLPLKARLIASVNRYPGFYSGSSLLFLLALGMALVPQEKRRRLVSAVGDEVTRLKSLLRSPCRDSRRLRMPFLFWRFVSPVAMLAVRLSEPGYYQLCTAQAQYEIPGNFSTPSTNNDGL